MATLALGIAGAAIGSSFGGTVAASLGWMIGSGLGNILFGSSQKITQEGTRLTDLKVQTSTYGNMITIVYGVIRVSGNVIWATDIVETKHTEEQSAGGKGGGPTVENVSYTYSANLAVGLCEGEIAGVRKIWANGKLIYNAGDDNYNLVSRFNIGNPSYSFTFSESGLGFVVSYGGTIRVYPGSETQNPDPLIQSHQGAANTPAFRGLAYVVFDNLHLGDYGNQIPNFTFEIVKGGFYHAQGLRIPTGSSFSLIAYNPMDGNVYSCDPSNGNIYRVDLNTNTVVASGNSGDLINILSWLYNPVNSKLYAQTPSGYYEVETTTFLTRLAWNATAFTSIGGASFSNLNIVDTQAQRLYGASVSVSGGTPTSRLNVMNAKNPSNTSAVFQYQWGGNDVFLRVLDGATGNLWGDNSPSSLVNPTKVGKWNVRNGVGQPVYAFNLPNTATTTANAVSMAIDSQSHRLLIYYNGDGGHAYICKVDLNTESIVSTTQVPVANGGNNPLLNTQERHIFYISTSNKIIHFSIDSDTYTSDNYPFTSLSNIINSDYDFNTDSELWGGSDASTGTGVFRYLGLRLTPDAHSLPSIVSDLCTRVNLDISDLDLSLLTGTVDGYFVANVSTARACIQQLMQAFYFDAAESDNKIKFVPRGNSSVLTITQDNLAAHVYGETVPDVITITRAQELDLPNEVDVVYLNLDQNYEQGTQYSRRIDKQNKKIETVQFPIAMNNAKGKATADILLYDMWVGRTTYEFITTLAYTALEPTDVITIQKGNSTYTVRIIKKEQDAGILKFTAVDEVPAIYTQNNAGAPSIDSDNSIYFQSPTQLFYMDIPCLRDADNQAGIYLAASPSNLNAAWKGSRVLRSVDNGNSYQEATSFFNAATSGIASTVLGNWTGGNYFDCKNTVNVSMISGELSGITEEQTLNGANIALLGNEIIIFRDVELIDTGVYKLSCFLRGRFGTEHYMSSHGAPERFVLLDSNIRRYNETVNDINSPYLYRPITFGNDLFSVPNFSYTDTGVCLKPLTVVHVSGDRDASLNLSVSWIRRSRIMGGWNDYADIPIGETIEAYEVDILDGSTVVRTIESSTTNIAYTAAEQTTDFGSTQSSVNIVIYQMSGIVGRGFGQEATV